MKTRTRIEKADSAIARIKTNLQNANRSFFSEDNISEFLEEGDLDLIVDKLTEQFTGVLEALIIDVKNDPNSKDTPRRLAKMYVQELLAGRYQPMPQITDFPNIRQVKDKKQKIYGGIAFSRVPFKSMCSHHHQIVQGVAYIGLLPEDNLIGLSKYNRLAEWLARRPTLQEYFTVDLAKTLSQITKTEDVAVCVIARHGCLENRGIGLNISQFNTTELLGKFRTPELRQEFMNNVQSAENRNQN